MILWRIDREWELEKMFLVNWFPWMIFDNIETERIWLNITKETLLIYNKKKTFLSKGGKSKNVLQSSRSHKIRYKKRLLQN